MSLHVGCKTALNGGTIYIPNAIYKKHHRSSP